MAEKSNIYIATKENKIEIFESISGKIGYRDFLQSANLGSSYHLGFAVDETYDWKYLGWSLSVAPDVIKKWFLACREAKKVVPMVKEESKDLFPLY